MSDGVKRYGGASETQLAKAEAISQIVAAQSALLEKRSVRVDLNNLSDVKQASREYTETCANYGILPTMEGLAAVLGHSRRGVYKYLANHPNSETTQFFDALRTGWAAMRISAADRGAASETVSIFLLLNSALDFTNEHKIAIEPQRSPYEELDPATARKRWTEIIDALPEPEE